MLYGVGKTTMDETLPRELSKVTQYYRCRVHANGIENKIASCTLFSDQYNYHDSATIFGAKSAT